VSNTDSSESATPDNVINISEMKEMEIGKRLLDLPYLGLVEMLYPKNSFVHFG
jgi:hypothetical protein